MDEIAENLIKYFETKEVLYFDKFYYSLYPLAYKISVLITKNTADAEDVAQTAFYTVFNQLETCVSLKEKNNQKIKSWFLSIVYNHSKLVVRSRVRNNKKYLSQERQNESKESNPQMSKYLESKMKEAINSLDEKYRTPLILKYNEGLNSNEISEILKVNEATLRVRISRGLSKIRELLSKNKVDFEELLPSISLLCFEDYSIVHPTPKFANKNAINMNLNHNENSYFFIKFITLCISIAIASVAVFFLYSPETFKDTSRLKPLVSKNENNSLQKIEWDFSKGNLNNFKVLKGNWDFKNDGMVTTGMELPFATQINLPIKTSKYFKIKFIGKLEFDAKTKSMNYALRGVYSKGTDIFPQTDLYNHFQKENIDYGKLKYEFGLKASPIEGTIYFTENYITTKYNGKNIRNISSVPLQKDLFNKSIFVRDLKTQKIEYSPLSEQEMQEFELETKSVLSTKEKESK